MAIKSTTLTLEGGNTSTADVTEGRRVELNATVTPAKNAAGDPIAYHYDWFAVSGAYTLPIQKEIDTPSRAFLETSNAEPGSYFLVVAVSEPNAPLPAINLQQLREWNNDRAKLPAHVAMADLTITQRAVARGDVTAVTMRRTGGIATTDIALWILIRQATEALKFDNYRRFIDYAFCKDDSGLNMERFRDELEALGGGNGSPGRRFLPFTDTDAYRRLKVATEAFMMVNCEVALFDGELNNLYDQPTLDDVERRLSLHGNALDTSSLKTYFERVAGGRQDEKTLPYLALIRDKLRDVGIKETLLPDLRQSNGQVLEQCFGILRDKLTRPCLLELIWSYWHEEGMLVQTMNALSRRFQNMRAPGERDPLANLEIDPLRPLNSLFWGYIQDEQHRLTMARRVYEYDHHYGISLYGKAVPAMRPADSRSQFLEAFHNLLSVCAAFFHQDDDTTVIADGFRVLNGLKEVHLILSQGAHNQFGELPSTARQEMLIQQWLLARPEFREFLPTRIMVAYPEKWMDRVDAMKTLQGWTDTSVLHFRNLGIFGEQVLLAIRFGDWSNTEDPVRAANWARFWRAEIQGYTHAYRVVTGVDLTAEITDPRQETDRYLQPSFHLRNRLAQQQGGLKQIANRLLGNGEAIIPAAGNELARRPDSY